MILSQKLHFEGSRGVAEMETLFDSGATYSLVRADMVDRLGQSERLPRPLNAETASEGQFLRIESAIRLEFYLNDLRLTDEFLVVPNLSEEAIIGAVTMQKWKIKLDFEHDTVVTDPRVTKVIIKSVTLTEPLPQGPPQD